MSIKAFFVYRMWIYTKKANKTYKLFRAQSSFLKRNYFFVIDLFYMYFTLSRLLETEFTYFYKVFVTYE